MMRNYALLLVMALYPLGMLVGMEVERKYVEGEYESFEWKEPISRFEYFENRATFNLKSGQITSSKLSTQKVSDFYIFPPFAEKQRFEEAELQYFQQQVEMQDIKDMVEKTVDPEGRQFYKVGQEYYYRLGIVPPTGARSCWRCCGEKAEEISASLCGIFEKLYKKQQALQKKETSDIQE